MTKLKLPRFLRPTRIFPAYWRFAGERQDLYMQRVYGAAGPWTRNHILQSSKFTNAYRAADRTSQFLISDVIYQAGMAEEDTILRVLLFKLFNKIETWEAVEDELGPVTYGRFDSGKIAQVLHRRLASKERIYSAAYILPPVQNVTASRRKHETHLALLNLMIDDGVVSKIRQVKSLEQLYRLLRGYPMFGPFLAFQMAVDLAYTDILDINEDEFVVAGPGALRGIRKCFDSTGGMPPAALIMWITEHQVDAFSHFGVRFQTLWGRELKPVDCQNLFCEFDKYARVAYPEFNMVSGPTRIKQKFRPTGALPVPWFPPRWGINSRINVSFKTEPLESTRQVTLPI